MVNQYVWIGIAIGTLVVGIGIGYAVFANTYTPPLMNPNNPQFNQMMNQMMNDPKTHQQMMTTMMNDPTMRQQMMQDQQFMQQMMNDPQFNQQMMQYMGQNQQFMNNMMNSMMSDPNTRQQMMGPMMQNQQFMNDWMNNQQFQQNWMYPHMMQNWMMGPGMGPGMMGGMMGPATDPRTVPAVQTDKVVIPPDAWNRRTLQPYQPLHIEVSQGTAVTWTNNDSVVHTVTSTNNEFDSNLIYKDNSWSFKFDSVGQYDYYCTIHPWMQGTVKVN